MRLKLRPEPYTEAVIRHSTSPTGQRALKACFIGMLALASACAPAVESKSSPAAGGVGGTTPVATAGTSAAAGASLGSGGTSGAGGIDSVGGTTSGGGQNDSLTPPSELMLSVADNRIVASWRDNSDNELGFRVYWHTEPVRAGAASLSVPPDVTTGQTQPLPIGPRTEYHLWVTAYAASAESLAVYGTISFPDGTTPLWSEEFDGPGINPANWGFDLGGGGWGNGELQVYSDSANNAFIENGMLVIRAQSVGNSFTSARLVTRGKRRFRYGRIEARIKSPSTAATAGATGLTDPGVWPALWLLPQDNRYGDWPSSGEIDIWELGGREPSVVSGAVHWNGANSGYNPVAHTATRNLGAPAANDFHVYAIEWNDRLIRWFVDGQQYLAFDHAAPLSGREPFKEDFYLVLNLAVGGSFARTGSPNPANYPEAMYVDWIRYYP